MPYVHLANGGVVHLTNDEMVEQFGDGPIKAYRDKGMEHIVVGVYPDEVELPKEQKPKDEERKTK